MRITFKQIQVFISIAKSGNMTRAAGDLFMSQSACSMALSAIEHQLGGALFDRHGKKLFLNDRGRVFFPKAANIIAQVSELQDLMSGAKGESLAGHLQVGASSTIGNYILPKLIGDFVNRHHQTKISLTVSNTEQIIQQLLKFEIDIGMIEGHCYADEIDVFPWRQDELVIVAPANHPLARKKNITLDMLLKEKWVLREAGSGTREKFEEALGGQVKPFLELGHTEAIKQAVLAEIGISCLSKIVVADLLKSSQLAKLNTPFLKLTRELSILVHQSKHKTDVLNQFMTVCKKAK